MRTKIGASWLSLAWVVACGGSTAARPSPAEPTGGYPGRCELLGIEYADVPREAGTEPEPGAVLLVARYRPGAASDAFTVRFRVEQRNADALRAHLEKHATLACDPERGSGPDTVDLPPLGEGAGEP